MIREKDIGEKRLVVLEDINERSDVAGGDMLVPRACGEDEPSHSADDRSVLQYYSEAEAPAKTPQVIGEWVMEPEVPEGGAFLLPVRRVFMEDRVQVRVVVLGVGHVKSVEITLREAGGSQAAEHRAGLRISSNRSRVGRLGDALSAREYRRLILRPWNDRFNDEQVGEVIGYSVRPDNDGVYLATSIELPRGEADCEARETEYVFKVDIDTETGPLETYMSRPLTAVRWWAHSAANGQRHKTFIERGLCRFIFDRQTFWNRLQRLVEQAEQHIFIANRVLVPGAADRAGAAELFEHLAEASGRGVRVFMMVDDGCGELVRSDYEAWLERYERARERLSDPPALAVSVHPDKILGVQNGCYHDSYVCIDGRHALIGEGDFLARRYPCEGAGESAATRLMMLPCRDGVLEIVGAAVWDLEEDFVRRWNQCGGCERPLHYYKPPPPLARRHIVQVVKTDCVEGRHGPEATLGTLDACRQAILGARHYIYMESPCLESESLRQSLVHAMVANPELHLMLVTAWREEPPLNGDASNHTEYIRYRSMIGRDFAEVMDDEALKRGALHMLHLQHRLIQALQTVDARRVRVYALARYDRTRQQAEAMYPQAGTLIVDDIWAMIGSTDLSGRGLEVDGEMNVVLHDRALVTAYRHELWRLYLSPKEDLAPDSREITRFHALWDRAAWRERRDLSNYTPEELEQCRAFHYTEIPRGLPYEGPFSNFPFIRMRNKESSSCA
ncbi:MAG: phosphatidylserine/phosphatidylglycerophosphate/cardiolipin synthase family protein [Verrucomicrobiota bacterium]